MLILLILLSCSTTSASDCCYKTYLFSYQFIQFNFKLFCSCFIVYTPDYIYNVQFVYTNGFFKQLLLNLLKRTNEQYFYKATKKSKSMNQQPYNRAIFTRPKGATYIRRDLHKAQAWRIKRTKFVLESYKTRLEEGQLGRLV